MYIYIYLYAGKWYNIAYERKVYYMDEKEDIEKMEKRNRFWNGFYESLIYALLGISVGLCGRMFIKGLLGIY